jgi:EGF-like domain
VQQGSVGGAVAAATPPRRSQSPPPKPRQHHNDNGCHLSCQNGGVCQFPKDDDHGGLLLLAEGGEPRCQCPDGYLGVQCEIKVRVCDQGSRGKCMNDQACIPENNGQYYHCECDPDVFTQTVSGENAKYNLQYCQSVTTTWCDGGGVVFRGDASKRKDMHYCYNAGKCKSKRGRRGGKYTCECPPGWSGAHCAMPADMAASAAATSDFGDGGGVGIGGRILRFFLITTLVFTVLMLCALGCLIQYGQVKSRRRKRKARKKKKEKQERQRLKKEGGGGRRRRRRQPRQRRRDSAGDDDDAAEYDGNDGIEMSDMGNTRDTADDSSKEESESSSESSGEESSGSEESESAEEDDSGDEEFEDEGRTHRRR